MKKLLLLFAAVVATSCGSAGSLTFGQKAKLFAKKGYGETCAVNLHRDPVAIGTQYKPECLSGVYLLQVVEASHDRIVYKYGAGKGLRYFYFTTDLVLYRIDRGVTNNSGSGGNIIIQQNN